MSQLSSYLQVANDKAMTQVEIVKAAAEAGATISQTTVSRYMSGLHPVPASRSVLEAFALVFELPLGRLLRLGGLPEELGVFELPEKAQVLDRAEREMVLKLVNFLADRKIAESSLKQNVVGRGSKHFNPDFVDVSVAVGNLSMPYRLGQSPPL